MTINVLDLFSGGGGISLGLEAAGEFKTVAFCEQDPDCHLVLKDHWPDVPIFTDVRTLTPAALEAQGIAVDFVCGGFPCQDASIGNVTGQGTSGARTGLYREALRLARDLGAGLLMENVPNLLARGFGDILRDMAQVGIDAEWDCISARDAGAGHERDRLWILADAAGTRWEGLVANNGVFGRARQALADYGDRAFGTWHAMVAGEPVVRSSDGVHIGMERKRLRILGNSVVPVIPQAIGRGILEGLPR